MQLHFIHCGMAGRDVFHMKESTDYISNNMADYDPATQRARSSATIEMTKSTQNILLCAWERLNTNILLFPKATFVLIYDPPRQYMMMV